MATATRTPAEDYLRTSYEPDVEYVNGQIVERHVGEYFHSWMQVLVAALLNERARPRRFRVFTEQRVQVSREPRYRIPDICVKALPHEVTPILVKPDLAIEILSPDDTVPEMLVKVGDYLQCGIPHIWIIDPYKRTVVEANHEQILGRPDGIVETELIGRADVSALFRQLDEPAE